MTSRTATFDKHRDIEIQVNAEGEFLLRALPFTEVPYDGLKFETAAAAMKAIDDDIAKARADSGEPVKVWLSEKDKVRAVVVTGVHCGRGVPVGYFEDGPKVELGSSYHENIVYPSEEAARAVGSMDAEVSLANRRLAAAQARLGVSVPRGSRIGTDAAPAKFKEFRALVARRLAEVAAALAAGPEVYAKPLERGEAESE